MTLTTDHPLLSYYLRNKMNPLLFTIGAAKDIPYKTDPKWKPIYSQC